MYDLRARSEKQFTNAYFLITKSKRHFNFTNVVVALADNASHRWRHRPFLSIRLSVVGVVSFVVHDKLVVDKVEAVGARLERILDHVRDGFLIEPGELVDVLAGVFAVRNAKSEIEVESLEVLVPKEMALDHSKIL
jgi:hypothetical protein